MKVRELLAGIVLAAAMTIGGTSTALAQPNPAAKNRVVFQVSDGDPKKWNLALNNAKNVQTDLGDENVAIEIVVYGPAIGMLQKNSEVGKRIAEALDKNIAVVACENTMKGQKLTYDDMLPKIGYVPAGVVEIMQKQQQGWAYVRP
jgi:intracellular sulfur oxidation DsrE/DsrF family protein